MECIWEKSNTYEPRIFIVAGSLLELLVLITVAGTSGGQYLQLSTHTVVEGVVELADYQVDSTILALTKDIFGFSAVFDNDEGKI